MSRETRRFIYRDAEGAVTARVVVVTADSGPYLEGICLGARAVRTFRKDRILEDLDEWEDAEARLAYWQAQPPAAAGARPNRRRRMGAGLEICFTGFKAAEKAALQSAAADGGMVVRGSVTEGLDFLCCGPNAGPKKREQAQARGAVLLTTDEFKALLETGELPESRSSQDEDHQRLLAEVDALLAKTAPAPAPRPELVAGFPAASAPDQGQAPGSGPALVAGFPVDSASDQGQAPGSGPAFVADGGSGDKPRMPTPRLHRLRAVAIIDWVYAGVCCVLFLGGGVDLSMMGPWLGRGWFLAWIGLTVAMMWRVVRGLREQGRGRWYRWVVGNLLGAALGFALMVIYVAGWVPLPPVPT